MVTLAKAIIDENISAISDLLRYGVDVNQLDEYGFRPLIEAAIVDNIDISRVLLQQGADPNLQDANGGTALQWAAENNNMALCKLLLERHANPNAYNFAGQPLLVMPMLRKQTSLRQLLIQHGADPIFAQDYINTKLLGHMFELMGNASIVSPSNQYVDVDFEGFFLEVTLGMIADSVAQFQNHFAARQLRRYAGLANIIVEVLQCASQLIKFQQYRTDRDKHAGDIDRLIKHDPLVIPIGYEGHAITFIKHGNIWVKCDRREDSRLYDNIVFYQVTNPSALTDDFIKYLLYEKQSSEFINEELDQLLGLTFITELKIDAQVSGNCSWANVEATIPAIFFLMLLRTSDEKQAQAYYKTLALNFFKRWREWGKDRMLHFCIQSYKEGDAIRKACKAEILVAILFQRCTTTNIADRERIETILNLLIHSPYEYILKNYVRVYYYEGLTEEGKRFAELLKEYGMKI
jgi:hypothetical protein